MKIESRKIIIDILMSVVFASLSYAQSGDDVWKNPVVKETDNYKFSVPAAFGDRVFSRGQ